MVTWYWQQGYVIFLHLKIYLLHLILFPPLQSVVLQKQARIHRHAYLNLLAFGHFINLSIMDSSSNTTTPPPSYKSSHADRRFLISNPLNSPQPYSSSKSSSSFPLSSTQPFNASSTPPTLPVKSPKRKTPKALSTKARNAPSPQPRPPNPPSTQVLNGSFPQLGLPVTIPTKKYPLSSGFPYHPSIFNLGISPDLWTLFSDEIVQATKLSISQQSIAWSSGIGIGIVAVSAVPPFGAAAGVFAGKGIYDKAVLNNVRKGLDQGKLGDVLKRWNEDYWREKGVTARLVVKHDKKSDNEQSHGGGGSSRGITWKKSSRRTGQDRGVGRFELLLEPAGVTPEDTEIAGDTNTDGQRILDTESSPARRSAGIRLANPDVELSAVVSKLSTSTPDLATEKAAIADTASFSSASSHPAEVEQAPRLFLTGSERNLQFGMIDGAESPTSVYSPASCVKEDPMTSLYSPQAYRQENFLLPDVEIPPTTLPTRDSMMPAALFTR